MADSHEFRKTCRRYNIPWQAHELTFSCFQRRPFLSKDRTCGYLAAAIDSASSTHRFDPWAYVFMSEHVHLLIWPTTESYSIPDILKSIKQSVSRKAIAYLRAWNPTGLSGWPRGGGGPHSHSGRKGAATIETSRQPWH